MTRPHALVVVRERNFMRNGAWAVLIQVSVEADHEEGAAMMRTLTAMVAVAAVTVLLAGMAWAQDGKAKGKAPATRPAKGKANANAKKTPPELAPIQDVAGLPRVLLIGDSISMGYTLEVRKLLEGKANVHRPGTNCGPTTRGLEQIDEWLGKGKWDVIHFNWGLYDLKYMKPDGNLADPNAEGVRQQVPPDQYEKNLRELVARMKKTGAKLIWASTTPVPAGSQGRIKGDAAKYNEIAKKVMTEAGVETDDLYALVMPKLDEYQQPKNVHFKAAGYKALARQVAECITKALGKGDAKGPAEKPKQ